MRVFALACIAASVLAAPGPLLSVAVAAEPGSPAAEEEARALFKDARLSYDVGKFADALDKLERAYAMFPTPVIQFNLAQVHRAMGHLKEARFLYIRYSDSMKKELEAATKKKERAAIEAKIANVETTIAELDKAIAEGLDKTPEPLPPETAKVDLKPDPIPGPGDGVKPPPAVPAKPLPWGKIALYGGVGLVAVAAVVTGVVLLIVQPGRVRIPDTELGFGVAFE